MSSSVGIGIGYPVSEPHHNYLSVSEIERLAKAGVKVEIGPVVPQSDPHQHLPQEMMRPKTLSDAIWDRWHQSRKATSRFIEGTLHPFELLASQHGEKVWVSVHPMNFNYEPFQLNDIAAIFPSDALMASLALWEKEHP